jgi:dihydrofolate synthase/folylpolyglutamate synthase
LRAGLRDLLDATGSQSNALVFSCLRDKPLTEMAQILFPLFDRVIFAPIHSPRATPVADLLHAAEVTGTPAQAASSVEEALALAARTLQGSDQESSTPARRIAVVSGSVYLVGEARALLTAGRSQ